LDRPYLEKQFGLDALLLVAQAVIATSNENIKRTKVSLKILKSRREELSLVIEESKRLKAEAILTTQGSQRLK
jgi:hypothetical protein